jgi:F-type H+-transporting ATPase subunit gamma
LTQKPRLIQLLPIQKQTHSDQLPQYATSVTEYVFEPSPRSILDSLLPYFIELTIYQSLLEARASEHSARMVAMKNASDNAGELVGDLELVYNRSRQARITAELSDIVTATLTVGGPQ